MKEYIFTEKSGIYIIDLQKTVESIHSACAFLREIAKKGGRILFVGTKKQAQTIIKEAAQTTGMFWVSERWLGGLLTNFETVRKSVARYDELEGMKQDGSFDKLSKKEASQLNKELLRLQKNLSGVREMKKLPAALFVIDPHREIIAVREAFKLKIPIVALVDTNCDPDRISHVVPGNDDAIRSIRLITSLVSDSIKAGADEYKTGIAEEKAAEEASKAALAQQVAPQEGDSSAEETSDKEESDEEDESLEKRVYRGKKKEKVEREKTIKHPKPHASRKEG